MAGRSPIILNQLGPVVGERIAAHPSRPTVLEHQAGRMPWDLPAGVEVLLTRPLIGWEGAPDLPPPGWGEGLRWIQSASTGMDFYPPWLLDGAPLVTCARGVSAVAIADYVITAILAFEKRWDAIRLRRPEDWRRETLGSLSGKRLGLAGFGAIGRAVAERALAFGLNVGAVRRSGWVGPEPGVEPFGRLEDLAAASDHLVLAMPLTAATRGLVGADLLARSKPGLHLVNVARGALVDQAALLAAIESGRIAGATLDVTDPEPLPAGHPFYRHPAIRLTPHVSWSAPDFDRRLADRILANLDAYACGEPLRDVVNADTGY
ncbi:phosphoglycerate dehydrogenase-like enzyme [Azospirillum lipoferum]|uniref:Glyoxylate reductase (NADP(+)) n=1 Tax=Azospirillum lipoferum TaxID=193 RepID=A0A5A9GJN6_AZOLI|nr:MULTISPECIES: D-isomer specific 2-hydroxyacid dehydrogenase family protein [Azospirillum]KAA0594533.1 glyoxylate reductase (NADP(+)) [Azospirillum lipoferum]MCP1613290.1 phosphoglycerate dehydrogenase-like enzyme [Azospirillum lipoferum]MDW5531489.1 D-isomer specific 2-hydroxyacid dehydrogenase family protein [Azospirillum sp. NL1]